MVDQTLSLFIRPCDMTDVERVLAIESSSFDDPFTKSLFVMFLQKFPKGFRVAEISGVVVGYSIIYPAKKTHSMIITSIAVDPHHRKMGIGSALLRDAVSIAKTHTEVKKIVLQVAENNCLAINLYLKLGFAKTDTLSNYYGFGRHGIEMEMLLLHTN